MPAWYPLVPGPVTRPLGIIPAPGPQTVTFTTSGTWTVPAGVVAVDCQCWGPGGKGGDSIAFTTAAGGGGGGEFAEETTLTVTPGTVITVTVGAGGTGTATSFPGASVTVTAHAGGNASGSTAGSAGSGSTNSTHHNGGAGGAGSASIHGGAGGGGSAGASGTGGAGGTTTSNTGGAAGTAGTGGGAAGGAGGGSSAAGTAGSAPGGGGGGAGGQNSLSGGAGAAGRITLTWTVATAVSATEAAAASETLATQATSIPSAIITAPRRPAGPPAPPIRAQVLLVPSGVAAPQDAAGAADALRVTSIDVTLTDAGGAVDYPADDAFQDDQAGAADDLAVSVSVPLPDSAAAADTVLPDVQVTLADAGAQTDVGQTTGLSQADTAGAAEAISVAVTGIAFRDAAAAAEGVGSATAVGASGGASNPQAYPGTSQVAVAAPNSGTWYYLGSYGVITALTYSFVMPGGADKMTCTLMVPASYRNQILNPGWKVRITRGGHIVWTGKLDEPQPTASGWQLTAVGDGNRGTDFLAIYSSAWPGGQPDQSINNAIARNSSVGGGLPWVNPGVGTPTGAWYGQAVDNGAQTITQLLNLICTRGGLVWYADSQPGGQIGTDLRVFPLPQAVNRLLVATGPVGRTLGGDINTIYLRYQATADDTSSGGSGSATYAIAVVTNSASIAAHDALETFIDISDAGVMSAGQAEQVGAYVMSIYVRASFAGPFTVRHGQLLNVGGAPVDPGTDQAGTVCRAILTDLGLGGEVTPGQPVTFLVGAYEWNDFSLTATVTPYLSVTISLTGLLSLESTILRPVTAGG